MKEHGWRKARALFWIGLTAVFIGFILFSAGRISIPGIPPPSGLETYWPWFLVFLILLATKALLELMRPVFRAALRGHVRYEADIAGYFQVVSYAVWATAFGLSMYIMAGGASQQFSGIGIGLASAALIYVMQEPLLNIVGWIIVITMRVYKLGDRIEMNNARGYVVEVSPMNTTIREFAPNLYGESFTGRHVTIPNSHVLKGNVFNYTKDTPFVWEQVAVSVTYESNHQLAERMILDAAEEVVGPMMRENRARLRAKYEFSDLADYIEEEPKVGWSLETSSVNLSLLYFCPVFAKALYRTRLVKRIVEKFNAEPTVQFAYPHMQVVSRKPEVEEKAEKPAKGERADKTEKIALFP